jgi:hypothetical protein
LRNVVIPFRKKSMTMNHFSKPNESSIPINKVKKTKRKEE